MLLLILQRLNLLILLRSRLGPMQGVALRPSQAPCLPVLQALTRSVSFSELDQPSLSNGVMQSFDQLCLCMDT